MNKEIHYARSGVAIVMITTLLLLLAACAPSPQTTSTPASKNTSSATRPGSLAKITSTTTPTHKTPTTAKPTPTPHPTTVIPTMPAQPTTTIPSQPTMPPTAPAPIPTPTQQPTSGAGSSATAQAAQAVFAQINQERASAGLPPLQWSNQLVQSAHNHNLTMQKANQLSHQLPGEPALGTRITNVGIHWSQAAENIGVGSGNPQSAATGLNTLMFNEKPPDDGHRLNILSTNTLIGIDVLVDTQHNEVWLTEDFAKPF